MAFHPTISPLLLSQPTNFHLPFSTFSCTKKSPSMDSISSYRDMLERGLYPDNFTFPSLLKSFADSRASLQGKTIHAHVIKLGFCCNTYTMNNLIRFYSVCGDIGSARKLFDRFPDRDVVSWTTLISGYSKTGLPKEAVDLFMEMIKGKEIRADEVTVAAVVSACSKLGDLQLGRKLVRYITENRVRLDARARNSLIDMYLKCGDVDSARKCFRKMHDKTIVSWNSMISGLVRNGEPEEALALFRQMQAEGLEPDALTLVAVLNSCAELGALESGEWAHVLLQRKCIEVDGIIANSLVDMYSKCGRIDRAFQVFDAMNRKDVYSYTSMVVGLAMHGQGAKALGLFAEMSRVGVKPNEATFVGVLSACNHAGLIGVGVSHFKDMSRLYGIEPRIEHYGCMVDMLGRAGLFDEARELVELMPIEPDAAILGALLGACGVHGNVALGESLVKRLVELEPESDGNYVSMSNMYRSADRRTDAIRVRKAMTRRKVKKRPGSSLVEIDGTVHEFRAGHGPHHPNGRR